MTSDSILGARSVDLGNVTDRRAIRERMKCKSFKWYLQNIYPESPIPIEYHSLGQVSGVSWGDGQSGVP